MSSRNSVSPSMPRASSASRGTRRSPSLLTRTVVVIARVYVLYPVPFASRTMGIMPETPRVLSSNVVYAGRLFNVELDEVELTTGVIAKRESIRHPGAVAMVPVKDDGRLLLVTQYRHAAGQRLLELPAGTLERGEEPLAAVARELQEEVGMLPGH